jgi:glycosyltransferase involved in cell wall biosynthesis
MRVVHVIGGLGVGGAERMLERLCVRHRHDRLIDPVVVSLTALGEMGERLVAQGFVVHALDMHGPLGLARAVDRLARLLRSIRPHIVQTWLYHADLIGALAARLAGCRLVVWNIRCSDPGIRRSTRVLMWCNAALSYILPDAILCCGREAARVHVAAGYSRGRMRVLPNGFDVNHFVGPERGTPPVAQAIRFIAIGRDDPAKDFTRFIQAAAIVARHDGAATFALYGRGIDDNTDYRRLIAETGLVDRFSLAGALNDVRPALSNAHIFCSTSRYEGFPNVIGEAMLMGLPTVATSAGDSAEIVGDTGRIVREMGAAAFATAMLSLADAVRTDGAVMAEAARRRIVERFEIGAVACLYAKFYRALVDGAAA